MVRNSPGPSCPKQSDTGHHFSAEGWLAKQLKPNYGYTRLTRSHIREKFTNLCANHATCLHRDGKNFGVNEDIPKHIIGTNYK